MIHPLVLGTGRRLFPEGMHASLRLTDSITTTKGVLLPTSQPGTQRSLRPCARTRRPRTTLRRAVACGAVHADRRGPARLELGDGEVAYPASPLGLLSRLLQTLRTEPTVRLAVLFGSLARGEESADSDIDILIDAGDAGRGQTRAGCAPVCRTSPGVTCIWSAWRRPAACQS
jgi:hypothetical protein